MLTDEFASHFSYKDILLLELIRQKYKFNNHLFSTTFLGCTNYRECSHNSGYGLNLSIQSYGLGPMEVLYLTPFSIACD